MSESGKKVRKKFTEKAVNWVAPEENRRLAKNTFGLIHELWDSVRKNAKVNKNIKRRSLEEGKPFFSNYVQTYGIKGSELQDSRRRFVIESRIMYIAACIGIFVTMFSFQTSSTIVNITSIIITFMLIVAGFVRSFRAAQIKHRSLFSFQSWLSMIDDWVV